MSLFDDANDMAEKVREERIAAKKADEVKQKAADEAQKQQEEHKKAREEGMI